MGEKGWGEDVSGGRGTGDGGRSRFPVVLSRTSPRGIPWVVSGRDTRAGTRDAVRATRARAWARGDSDAPNPDVGGSRRPNGERAGGRERTTRAGDGRTSSSSDFSRMRSSRSLCVSRSCFLSAACARARRGWSGSIAAPASPSASGSNSGLAPSSYSGPSELLMVRRGRGTDECLSRGGGEAMPCAAVPSREGVWRARGGGGSQRTAAISPSARPAAPRTRDDDDPKRGTGIQ